MIPEEIDKDEGEGLGKKNENDWYLKTLAGGFQGRFAGVC